MRWIQKRREPRSLAQYRNGPAATWEGFPKKEKNSVQSALLAEQGHLCAYCMRRIELSESRRNMKNEHWTPRNLLDEAEKLNYQNMLGVCEGLVDGEGGKEETCDTNWLPPLVAESSEGAYTVTHFMTRNA